ncbi:LuxR C-terminal-related transcriptional regulator [Actinoplanes sp. NEAU-A12]|uniref:LuxR C-terminal-related transcriptional regulator n=1 Tax=Actinoplanes sandaracinus TaxID=3045177 RepID=A0ABT6WGQ8_9ACTN|nr:LuxR C-terminal-related transcriptional regulator [Actinoplanes sandaracinus]MDI6098916.1 LuxR C-terminal-related transcriptional regulator [Actinoplanes sandaracinus]
MPSAWPYLERHPVRDRVLDALRAPREPGVLLVGPYGCGKTYLLRALSEDLRQRGRLLHAAAVTEAAITHAAPVADVLLIDDIDRLDDRALGLLADAATTGERNLIATTRPLLYPDLALRARGLNLAVTPVPALTEAEIRTYCTSRLGGPIDDLSLAEIGDATAGLPLLVREVIDTMLAQDQLRTVHGVWRLDGAVRFSIWFGQAAAASLAPLSPGERDLLQLLAIIDGIPLPLAEALSLHDSLERLEQRGLLTVSTDDRAVLSPAAGWLAPAVQAGGTGTQRRRLADACLRALREPVDRTGLLDPLDTAKLRMTAGRPVDLDHAITAAGAALEHHAPRWAQQLLHPHATDPASSPLLADTLIRQACPRSAERMLGLSAASAGAESRGRLAAERLDVLILWLADVRTAQRVVMPPGCPGRPHRLDPAGLLVAACAENVSSLLPTLRKRSENTPLAKRDGQRVFLAHLYALLAGGQAQAALHAVTEIGDTFLGQFVPDLRLAVLLLFGRALLTVSRIPEALDVARRLAAEGRRLRHGPALAAGLALAGAAQLRGGALDDAGRSFRHALAALHGREAGWTQARALTGLALCQAWHSGAEPAGALDEVRAAAQALGSPDIDEMAGLTTAQILLIRGRIHPAGEQALRVAARAESLGRRATVAEALLVAGQAVPDLDVAQRLTRLADDCDYDLPQVHAGYLTALARRSGAALDACARGYQQRGLRLLAAAASAHAQAHLRTAGEQVTANSSARRLTSLISETGITVPMAWPAASPLVPLTVREQEVAALVARGLSSEKIAEMLRLSVRTVDNHLQHCYRKLGVSSRAQLTETLKGGPDRAD